MVIVYVEKLEIVLDKGTNEDVRHYSFINVRADVLKALFNRSRHGVESKNFLNEERIPRVPRDVGLNLWHLDLQLLKILRHYLSLKPITASVTGAQRSAAQFGVRVDAVVSAFVL